MEGTDELVIEKGTNLKEWFIQKTIQDNTQKGIETDEEQLREQIIIRPIGEMEFIVDGKIVKKCIFSIELEGHTIDKIYTEDFDFLGVRTESNPDIILADSLSSKPDKEQQQLKEDLTSLDWEAKTLEELKEEQKEQEANKETSLHEEKDDEEQEILPGLNEEEPQLTKAQVDSLEGPKTSLNQVVNGRTLANTIGLEGEYIQIVDADMVRKMNLGTDIPADMEYVPLEINANGAANIIGEDKLKPSSREGKNSSGEHTTVTNDGSVREEQNYAYFDIVKSGYMETIAMGKDESYNGKSQQEIKFGVRDREQPSKIAFSELETVHNDPVQDNDSHLYRIDATEGIEKGTETIDRAEKHQKCGEELEVEAVDSDLNNNPIHEEDVIEYAQAMNIRVLDGNGYPTNEYDLETARIMLEEKWAQEPELSLEELIEQDQHTLGPGDPPRRW